MYEPQSAFVKDLTELFGDNSHLQFNYLFKARYKSKLEGLALCPHLPDFSRCVAA